MIYPSFFACPAWSYNKQTSEHLRRVQFDNGWTRQRKRFAERNNTVSLTLTMSSAEFAAWSAWWVNNAYDWFEMTLAQGPATVRSVSPINYSYQVFDTVNVSVTVEEFVETDGQNTPIPLPPQTGLPGIPGTEIYCLEYECDAYEDELIELGYTATPVWSPTSELDWPFSTVRSTPGLYDVWGGYVSSPSINTDFGGTVQTVNAPTFGSPSTLSFCAGELAKCIQIVPNSSQTALTPTGADHPQGLTGRWGWHSISMVFTGTGGSTAVSGEFARNTGCPYYVTGWTPDNGNLLHRVNATVYAYMSQLDANSITIGLSSNDDDFGPAVSATVEGFADDWASAVYSAGAGEPYMAENAEGVGPPPPNMGLFQDCWASLSVNGVTISQTWTIQTTNTIYSIVSLVPNTDRLLYDGQVYFRQGNYVVHQLASQVLTEEVDVELLHNDVYEAFLQNSTDYEDSDVDCTPVPTNTMGDPIPDTVIVEL